MMSSADLSLWGHILGFATGIVLYAMLAVMAWQGGRVIRWPGQAIREQDKGGQAPLLLIVAAGLGLALSIATNALHLSAFLRHGWLAPRGASWLIVGGYAVLMGLIAVHMWRLTAIQRALSVVAIGVFAVSAVHFLVYWGQVESLPVELVVHYAPLPLVAALLYQEYRFALADLFLKRALAFIVLVMVASMAYVLAQTIGSRLATVALWIGTALAYPVIRDKLYALIDRLVLRRATVREVRARLGAAIDSEASVDSVLERACVIVREALTARWVTWTDDTETHGTGMHRYTPNVLVPVLVADEPRYVIAVGALAGGRRLLSGDMTLVEMVALDVARRIDAIRISEERYERTTREAEILRLATEAELRALQAQLNPHFLFNALTTIGYLIQAAPDRALATLLRLTDLLRAVLRRTSGSLVTVREELALVEAYLAIERERFEERLETRIDVPDALSHWKIPPLLIQPLVENAIKHGITPVVAGGLVSVSISVSSGSDGREQLLVRVEDTGAGAAENVMVRGRRHGIGLGNIERRIQQYYGNGATLTVNSVLGSGTIVQLMLPKGEG